MGHSRTFQVSIKGFDRYGVLQVFYVPVTATTTWHAIELAYSKYCRVQPNRKFYSAK